MTISSRRPSPDAYPEPANFVNAAAILRRLFGTLFPKLGEKNWKKYARRTFKEADGRLVPDYDVKLGTSWRGQPRQAATGDAEGIRCTRPSPGDGHSQRQFGHPFGRDG